MVQQKGAESKKHSHAEIWLDYWGSNVSHNDSDTLYQSTDERRNIQNACSTRCRVESFNLFLKQKRRPWNHVAGPFSPSTLCNSIRKAHRDGKEKETFSLLPFSIFLAGLMLLGGFECSLNGSDCALASSVSVSWLFWGLLLLTNAATADLLTQKFKICWIIKETFDSIHSTKGGWFFSLFIVGGLISFQTYLKLELSESKTFWRCWHADARPSETQWPHGYCTRAACEHSNDPKRFKPSQIERFQDFSRPYPRIRTILLRLKRWEWK